MLEPNIEKGRQKLTAGDFREAQEAFNQVLEVSPDRVDALQGKIATLRQQEEYEEAHNFIQKAFGRLGDADEKLVGIWDELGWLYHDQGQYAEAIEAFEQALALAPADPGGHCGKVRTLRQMRRYDDMAEAAEAASEQLPTKEKDTRAAIWNELGWAHWGQGQFEAAHEAFAKVLEVAPKDTSALTGNISVLRFARDFDKAHEAVEDACQKIDAGDPETLLDVDCECGWLQFEKNEYAQAIATFDTVLEEEPYHESALQGKAASLRMMRRFDKAQDVIESALAAHENVGQPKGQTWGNGLRGEIGWLHFSQGQFEQAERAFAQALAQAPENVDLNFSRVEALIKLKCYGQAYLILRRLRKKYPQDLSVQNQLGRFYTLRNRLDQAEDLFNKVLRKEPESVDALVGLGAVRFHQTRYEEAEKCFERALEVRPHIPQIHCNLAWTLLRQHIAEKQATGRRGYNGQAPSWLATVENHAHCALELCPAPSEKAGACGCLGVLAYRKGDILEARDYLRESVRADHQAGNHVDLGALCTEIGHFAAAEQHLKTALEVDEDDVQAFVELGNLYLRTEQYWEARRAFRQAVGLNLRHVEARRGLAIALMELKRYEEAEETLREAMFYLDLDQPLHWRLHLTLSQVLGERARRQSDHSLFEEALAEVEKAFRLKPEHPDLHFQSAVLRFGLEDYKGAARHFRNCADRDERQFLAALYARKVESFLKNETADQFFTRVGGGITVIVSTLVLMILLFTDASGISTRLSIGSVEYVQGSRALAALIPILLGFIVIGFALPALIRFRLPGLMEAELSPPEPKVPKETIILGPKGNDKVRSSIAMGGSGHRFWY